LESISSIRTFEQLVGYEMERFYFVEEKFIIFDTHNYNETKILSLTPISSELNFLFVLNCVVFELPPHKRRTNGEKATMKWILKFLVFSICELKSRGFVDLIGNCGHLFVVAGSNTPCC